MRQAFPLRLLVGLAARLFALRPGKMYFVLALARVFRGTGLIQGDCDSLAATLHPAGLSASSALQFVMLDSCITRPMVFL